MLDSIVPSPQPLDLLAPLPRLLSPDLEIGGVAKSCPEDFIVEELPAYEPSGTGEHLFLWIEKAGLPAHLLLSHVSRALRIKQRDIGCAGQKDTRAITRQYLSVPASAEARLAELGSEPRMQLLGHALHANKLRTGHLRGNRFTLRLRNCHPAAAERLAALRTHLQRVGMPNYFGEQRFGRGGATLQMGLRLLREPVGAAKEGGRGPAPRALHRLALSSVQSALFNRLVAHRLTVGSLHRVLCGEVMLVRASGGPFVVEDVAREQPRLDAREIVGAGAMMGPKMRLASGEMAALEAQMMRQAGLEMADFARHKSLLQGTRRANLIFFDDLQVEWEPEGRTVRLQVDLPPGAYATTLLREMGAA